MSDASNPATSTPAESPDSTTEMVRRALGARLDALLDERGGVRASDPGAVHRMRVASRRVREALRVAGLVLGGERVRELMREGRRVTRALGRLREEQVGRAVLEELGRDVEGDAAAGFDYLILRFDHRIAKHREAAFRRLAKTDLRRFEKRVRRAVDPDRLIADRTVPLASLIEPAARAADESLQAVREQPDDEHLHALRIAIKRLRYAVEVLVGSTGRGARYGRSLRRLQDVLGRHNDLAVLAATLAREKSKLAAARRTALERAVGAARRQVVLAKRDALGPVARRLEKWPPGSLLRRSIGVVRAASRGLTAAPAAPATSARAKTSEPPSRLSLSPSGASDGQEP